MAREAWSTAPWQVNGTSAGMSNVGPDHDDPRRAANRHAAADATDAQTGGIPGCTRRAGDLMPDLLFSRP